MSKSDGTEVDDPILVYKDMLAGKFAGGHILFISDGETVSMSTEIQRGKEIAWAAILNAAALDLIHRHLEAEDGKE